MASHLNSRSLLVLSCFTVSILANPFGTINDPFVLGQHNEHEMITRIAFQCPDGQKSDGICFEPTSLNQLAGTHGSVPLTGMNGAVGAPDTLDPVPEGPEAHCDDADFMDIPGYPRTRDQATQQLQNCVNHLRGRFQQAWQSAAKLLNDKDEISEIEVDLSEPNGGDCTFSFPYLQINALGRAKCNVIEALGRGLHGVEDFYSHSNWADHEDSKKPISTVNPPGLGISAPAPFLDLRATGDISSFVPHNLSTGCFFYLDRSPGVWTCKNRVTHDTLNKDHGIIGLDGSIGASGPKTPRSDVAGNFALAVNAAVSDARRQWDLLRDEIKRIYGDERGNLMICALVRDDPINDCRGRRIAIVIDSSGSNADTDPGFLRVQAAIDFTKKLTSKADAGPNGKPDNVTVIDFDDSARVIYPFGDPASATFEGIDANGGTDIGSGISLAIDQITQDQSQETIAHRSGMIVLTDGQDGNPANQILQLGRCALLGIRVNYGFLSPPSVPVPKNKMSKVKRQGTTSDVQLAILKTGGIFGTIDSAQAQKRFIDTVIARGATDIDSVSGSLLLTSGVTITDFLNANKTLGRYIYNAVDKEHLIFTVALIDGSTTELSVALRDVRANTNLGVSTASTTSSAIISYNFSKPADLEVIVTTTAATLPANILFTVGLDTNMPNKTSNSNPLIPLLPPGPSALPSQTQPCVGPYCEAAYRAANTSLPSSGGSASSSEPPTSSTSSASKSYSTSRSTSHRASSSKAPSTKLPTYGHPSPTTKAHGNPYGPPQYSPPRHSPTQHHNGGYGGHGGHGNYGWKPQDGYGSHSKPSAPCTEH